jgi:hypothetical protein
MKVGVVMNYVKQNYDHVIIISHLDALKSQADQEIVINCINGLSYVNNVDRLKQINNIHTCNKNVREIVEV